VDQVIVVDDGSADDPGLIAGLAGAEVVKREKNKGKVAALKSGFEKAKEFDPDVLVCLDPNA
jgi:glycosyltransferase involved in cell wall biosynthesis